MLKLHAFCQSGNAFKIAFALRAMELPYTTQFVDFMSGVTRSSDWRESTNPMGEVPVLEDGDQVLTQSAVILFHLAEKSGRLGPVNVAERNEILRWMMFDNHKFTSYFASYRFNKAFGAAAPDPTIQTWLRGRIDNAWGVANKHLESHDWIACNRFTIADISLSGYVFFPTEESGIDMDKQFPALGAWRKRLKKVKGWADPYEILPGTRLPVRW
jgi:glutathione S-transferase